MGNEAGRRGRGTGRLSGLVGTALLLFGVGLGGMVIYQGIHSENVAVESQQAAAGDLEVEWESSSPVVAAPATSAAPQLPVEVAAGQPVAILRIPRLGADWSRVVVEGTSQAELAQGPGHYVGTAMPGQPGNFSVAGHRVGTGSPFLNLGWLVPGDRITVETPDGDYVYQVIGSEIVVPTAIEVIAPTPPGLAAGSYLTMTTCHPKHSARQRLIVHAQLLPPPPGYGRKTR